MSPKSNSGQGSCHGGCHSCPSATPPPPPPPGSFPFEGVGFGLIAFAYFIIPTISALLGAHFLGAADADLGALGAVGGMIAGATVCAILARRFFPAKPRRYTGGLS